VAKSNNPTRKSQTHFEQVPVEVLKKIAKPDASKGKKGGTAHVAVEPAARKKG